MEEAERCDRLAILSQGKLVALGMPTELKREIGGDVILFEAADPRHWSTHWDASPSTQPSWIVMCVSN
jgi:ABC-2 type transport system ATP-binding protein